MTTSTVMNKAPEVGHKASELVLPTSTGGTFNLTEATQRGPVVVCFMPGAFTGTCTKEMCAFTAAWPEYEKLGAQVVGVTVDSKHAQNAWAAKENIKIPLLSDFEKKVAHVWGVPWSSAWGLTYKRATFVVDRSGIVRYANIQANAGDEPAYAEIKAALAKLR